jgi:hypothetical protein
MERAVCLPLWDTVSNLVERQSHLAKGFEKLNVALEVKIDHFLIVLIVRQFVARSILDETHRAMDMLVIDREATRVPTVQPKNSENPSTSGEFSLKKRPAINVRREFGYLVDP